MRPRLNKSLPSVTKSSRRMLAGIKAQSWYSRNPKVIRRRSAALQDADEEAIGTGRARRHQNAFVRQPRRLRERRRAVAQRLGNLGRRLHRKLRMARQERAHLGAVFLV